MKGTMFKVWGLALALVFAMAPGVLASPPAHGLSLLLGNSVGPARPFVLSSHDFPGAPPNPVDLAIVSTTVPAQVSNGQQLNISASLRNQGTALAGSSTTRFVISGKPSITATDTALGTVVTPSLGSNATTGLTTRVTIPFELRPGTYYIGAIADATGLVPEANEDNNASDPPATVSVINGAPSLVVSKVESPPGAALGTTLGVSVTFMNVGALSIPTSFVNKVYLSRNGQVDSNSVQIGSFTQTGLATGATVVSAQSFSLSPSLIPTVYSLCVVGDANQVVPGSDRAATTLCTGPIVLYSPGTAADVVVTKISLPAKVVAGDPVTVTATVGNIGGTPVTTTFANTLFVSETPGLDTVSVGLTSFPISGLASGEQTSFTTTVALPADLTPGTYYMGVFANSFDEASEATNTNNVAVTPFALVAPLPDLDVPAVSPPINGAVGQPLTINAAVQNLAETPVTTGFLTNFYLCTEQKITSQSILLAQVPTPPLAGASATPLIGTGVVTSTVAAGVYFAGVQTNPDGAIAESTLANNSRVSPAPIVITSPVGSLADAAVTRVYVPSAVSLSGSILTTAGVSNLGGTAINTRYTLRYFLSTTRTIPTSPGDTIFLGNVEQTSLPPGQTLFVPGSFPVPSGIKPGASYFVGVTVDPSNVLPDGNTGNNTNFSDTPVSFVQTVFPDLIPFLGAFPKTLNAGTSFSIREEVDNLGQGAAPAGWVSRWVLTPTTVVNVPPAILLADFVNPVLQRGSAAVVTRNLTVPANTAGGTYQLALVANPDFVVPESSFTNNVSISTAITVVATRTPADLAILDPPVSNPTTIAAGGFGAVTFDVRNLGQNLAPGPFSVGVYLTTTSAISTAGIFLGSMTIPTLSGGQNSGQQTFVYQVPPNTQPGAYFLGVVADITSQVLDSNRSNNASSAVPILVQSTPFIPDLVALTVSGPASAAQGSTISISCKFGNSSGAAAGFPFFTSFTLRSGATGSIPLGRVQTQRLDAFASTTVSLSATIPVTAPLNAYFIDAFVDATNQVDPEVSETNNKVTSTQTIAITAPAGVANLLPTQLSGPPSAVVGSRVSLNGFVRNAGPASSVNGFTNSVYLSKSPTPTTTDTLLATFTTPTLPTNQQLAFTQAVQLPGTITPGAYFLGVIVNQPATILETTRTDNAGSVPITIFSGPDLLVQSLTLFPNPIDPGGVLITNTTVKNAGPAGIVPPPTTLLNRFYLGKSNPVTIADTVIGESAVPIALGIPVGASVANAANITLPNTITAGTYFVGVLTDASSAISEQQEGNNLFTSSTPLVVNGGAALVAQAVSAPASVRGGTNMPVTLTIANSGQAAPTGSLAVQFNFVLDSDQTQVFPLATLQFPADQFLPGATPNVTGTVPISTTLKEGVYRLQAVLDPNHQLPGGSGPDEFHTVLADNTTGVNQGSGAGPICSLSYSHASPVPAGELTITADFSRPVSGPKIAINTPGSRRVPLTPMTGGGTRWTYLYQVPKDNGSFDRDGVNTVRIEGAVDVDGLESPPVTQNNTFVSDTVAPVFDIDVPHEGDLVTPAPLISGHVVDKSAVNASIITSGNFNDSATFPFMTSPPGAFNIPDGQFSLPNPINILRFGGTDAAGNVSPGRSITVYLDTDGDGLPDQWETDHGLNERNPADAFQQAEGFPPGVTNLQVYQLGVDPNNPTTVDPATLVPRGTVAPRATVPPGVIRPRVTVTSNPPGGTVTFAWRQVDGPQVSLLGATSASPSFIGKVAGNYAFSVVLTNSVGRSPALTQEIIIEDLSPVAAVAAPSRVQVGVETLLDGSASSDPNGDPLTFSWRADANNPSSTTSFSSGSRATFTPSAAGTYRFFLSVQDPAGHRSGEIDVTYQAADPFHLASPPTADAGLDQIVKVNQTVQLDGTSSRPGTVGGTIAYAWTQISGPAVVLAGATSSKPTFLPTQPGVVVLGLVVTNASDALKSTRAQVRVVVTPALGRYPTALVGADQTVIVGTTVTLDGSQSRALANGALSYAWRQASGPALATGLAAVPKPSFTPILPGDYAFTLTVADGGLVSPAATALVHVVANAGDGVPVSNPTVAGQPLRLPQYKVTLPSTGSLPVNLDGGASFDPGGRPLAYRWSQVFGPAVALTSLETVTTSFLATTPGVHRFQLSVSNGDNRGDTTLDVVVDGTDQQVPLAAIEPLPSNRTSPGKPVTLQAASNVGSQNPTYNWVQKAGPICALDSDTAPTPTFTPVEGFYTFNLFVTANTLRSQAASYSFTAVSASSTPPTTGTTPTPTPTPTPAPGRNTGGGGGGGAGGCEARTDGTGAPDLGFLVLLLTPVMVLLARRASTGSKNP